MNFVTRYRAIEYVDIAPTGVPILPEPPLSNSQPESWKNQQPPGWAIFLHILFFPVQYIKWIFDYCIDSICLSPSVNMIVSQY